MPEALHRLGGQFVLLRFHIHAHLFLQVNALHKCRCCPAASRRLHCSVIPTLPMCCTHVLLLRHTFCSHFEACSPLPVPRNAHSFPQDRATGYKIYAVPPPDGAVLWTQFVHGTFYQVRGAAGCACACRAARSAGLLPADLSCDAVLCRAVLCWWQMIEQTLLRASMLPGARWLP